MAGRTVRGFPEPETMKKGIVGVCKWGCGRPVKKPALYWHKECFEQYALHTLVEHQKRFLIKRDGQRCAMIGCGCAPMKWLGFDRGQLTAECIHFRAGAPDMIAWRAELWSRPSGRWADRTDELRRTGWQSAIERVCALEVDHRVPLWEVADLPDAERRWYFGPGNLWLLCPRCHKVKTAREATQRARERRLAADQLALPIIGPAA
jgi:hypothetical protein